MKKLVLLLLLATVACNKEEEAPMQGELPRRFSPTFILGYEPTERYYIRRSLYQWLEIYIDYLQQPYSIFFTPVFYAGAQPEEERQQFEHLSQRNGDTSYNRETVYYPGETECWADNFQRIEVVCTNRDMDAAHPTGTPLDDLLIASTYTCGPYVRSGYQGKEFRTIEKPLPEMKPEDMEMLKVRNGFRFRFASSSELSGSYDLEIRLTTTDGKKKLATGTVEFPYTPSVWP